MSSTNLRAAILIISDTASADASTDKAGPALASLFAESAAQQWDVAETKIVPDDVGEIQRAVVGWCDGPGVGGEGVVNLVVTSGGTGFAVKDRTPEVSLL